MKVVTIVANNPIFIELQYKTLKRFLHCDYEFIIFNDGKDWPDITNFDNVAEGRQGIKTQCEELQLQCFDIPNEHHRFQKDASNRHCDSLKHVLNYMRSNMDEYLVLDSDMFLIDDLDLSLYRKYVAACVLHSNRGVYYFWPNFFYLNTKKARNMELMNLSYLPDMDSGSASSVWLKSLGYESLQEQPVIKELYFIKHLSSCSWDAEQYPRHLNSDLIDFLNSDPRNENGKFFCELYDKLFLHYRAGTNWRNESKHLHSTNIVKLREIINKMVSQ